jgi:hypothetical protein
MQRSNPRGAGLFALSALLAVGLTACGSDKKTTSSSATSTTNPGPKAEATVSVTMTDYAFAVSGPLVAGGTLKVANNGTEFHMLGMGRLKPGKTLADVQTAISQQGGEGGGDTTTTAGAGETTTTAGRSTTTTAGRSTTTTAGGSTTSTLAGGGENQNPFADIADDIGIPGGLLSPGQSAEITAPDLTPGSYALICFIPQEGTGMPHATMGMISQLDVVAGPAPAAPTADATYKVATGKAVEGPATLTAGRHTLRIEAAAGSEQLEPGLGMVNPGTTVTQFLDSVNKLFESDSPPAKGAAASVPGKVVYAGFDLHDVTSFYLTVDLKPGTYFIDAQDTDVPNPAMPPKELINIKVA